jgi:predicted DNA repair protein MutK
MASGFFLLLDDIAILADDVAAATKIATQKTFGILGDDIAVSAQKSTGFEQQRELKIIWAITKGSLRNKVVILPVVFFVNIIAPFLLPYILILGAFYLSFEGVESIWHYIQKLGKKPHNLSQNSIQKTTNKTVLSVEQDKIKSAILMDFILSVEIIVIALSSVIEQVLILQIISVSLVAMLATFGVYGLVALIVRIDNVGFWLIARDWFKSGHFLIALMPKIIKVLAVIGTIAMLLISGDMLLHNVNLLHPFNTNVLNSLLVGFLAGVVVFLTWHLLLPIWVILKKS